MQQKKLLQKLPWVATLLINLLLLLAVIYLMGYVQNLLNLDTRINLTEIVTQNKDAITSKLMLEVNNLDLVANQLEDELQKSPAVELVPADVAAREGLASPESPTSPERLSNAFLAYVARSAKAGSSERLFIATEDGQTLFPNGETYSISGRRYFRLAMEGRQNISDHFVSRKDGEEMFAISVPVRYGGAVIGTVQQLYTPTEMYDLCSVSLFSSQGSMYIINSDGYILVNSQNRSDYSQESDNFYRFLYSQGNAEASKQLEEDIKENRSGFLEATLNSKKFFSAYTPIEQVHDWYLISSIATDAVSPNSRIVIRLFYIILIIVVLVFAVTALAFFRYKNRQQEKLQRIAFLDAVTQGNTFTKFSVDLQELLAREPSRRRYLLAFDIDNFKYVNSYYGFDCGDRILRQLNASISAQLLPGELLARISGDHFIVLLEDVSPGRLADLLEWTYSEDGIVIYLSAGLYHITDPTENINLMLDKATSAAEVAKGSLHKRVELYTEKFDQQMYHNEYMKRSLQNALANDEIIPFFQPKVNVLSGELVGAEALARWCNAQGKLVPPVEFIPICENTGLIIELDMMIFEKTLRFLRKNMDEGVRCVPISVNFSRLHLNNKDFIPNIVAKLKQHNVPSFLIEVELTESVIFENSEIIALFAEQLHQHGLVVAMDDFGSGYSSLNLLKDIPIDILKIDRAFLQETTNLDKQCIILSTIAEMAEKLSIRVVVEGVETPQNVEMMKEFGCFVAQGYYFAKPMDASDFDKIFKEGALWQSD